MIQDMFIMIRMCTCALISSRFFIRNESSLFVAVKSHDITKTGTRSVCGCMFVHIFFFLFKLNSHQWWLCHAFCYFVWKISKTPASVTVTCVFNTLSWFMAWICPVNVMWFMWTQHVFKNVCIYFDSIDLEN